MKDIADDIIKTATELQTNWSCAFTFLSEAQGKNGERLNHSTNIPGLNVSIKDVNLKMTALPSLLIDVGEKISDERSNVLILKENVITLRDALSRCNLHTKQIIDNEISIRSNGGIISIDNFSMFIKNANNADHNIAGILREIYKSVQIIIGNYKDTNAALNPSSANFSHAVADIQDRLYKIRETFNNITDIKSKADVNIANMEEILNTANNNLKDITNYKSESNTNLSQASTNTQKSNELLENINNINDKAINLEGQVRQYQDIFNDFQNKLDIRTTEYKKSSEQINSLIENITEIKEEIDQKNKDAEAMLTGATTAGLASAYEKALNETKEKLETAKRGFYLSIFLFLCSSIPLIGYLAAKLFLDGKNSSIQINHIDPTIVSALIIIMVPTIWATKFSAARHHNLFILKELYQHKYSLAMAVDGFKKQAPEYAEAIAAATFKELLNNPADRIQDSKAIGDHPNPLFNAILDKLGINDKGKSEPLSQPLDK